VKELEAKVENDQIVEFRINAKISFDLESDRMEKSSKYRIRIGKANYSREGGLWDSLAHGKREGNDPETSSTLQRGGEDANCRSV